MPLLGEVSIFDMVPFSIHPVDSSHEGEFNLWRMGGPVASARNEHQWPWRTECCDFGIIGDMRWTHVDRDAALTYTASEKMC